MTNQEIPLRKITFKDLDTLLKWAVIIVYIGVGIGVLNALVGIWLN